MLDNEMADIEKALDNYANEYAQMVKTFDKSTMNTEDLTEEKKMKIRMDALEIRCKNSQFLLESIIATLQKHSMELPQIKQHADKANRLLMDVRKELHNNDLLAMIKFLEHIPLMMAEIHNDIKLQIQQTPTTLH